MNTNPEKRTLGRVFVVGAHIPAGGTYMAYQIGKLICENWGHEFVSVEVSPEEGNHSVWSYEYGSCKLTMEEMMQQANRSDVLICNPSFSSFMWGLSFPGRKLMYVQDIKTYAILTVFSTSTWPSLPLSGSSFAGPTEWLFRLSIRSYITIICPIRRPPGRTGRNARWSSASSHMGIGFSSTSTPS